MCILSYLAPGIDVDVDGLLNGGVSNPHGHGWAITAGDHIQVGKSMDLVEALDTFEKARAKNMSGHALFHSRWATHGSRTTANVHPFFVGGQGNQTVVGHNGILHGAAIPAKGDDRSDTRKFADELLSTKYRRLDKPRAYAALEDFIGLGNKLVILTVANRYRRNAYIVNEQLGEWDDATGIWHSNGDYLDTPRWYKTYRYGGGISGSNTETVHVIGGSRFRADEDSAYGYEECAFCYYGAVQKSGYCDECGSCADCMETEAECQCYNGERGDDDDAERNAWEDEQDRLVEPAKPAEVQLALVQAIRDREQWWNDDTYLGQSHGGYLGQSYGGDIG